MSPTSGDMFPFLTSLNFFLSPYERVCPKTICSFEMKFKEQIGHWVRRLQDWISVKRLEHDLRDSRRFQKYCEKFGCSHLTALEKSYQAALALKIRKKKNKGATVPCGPHEKS